jgi:hypothetical protein
VGNSRSARKLARTPHVNQKKKKNVSYVSTNPMQFMEGKCKIYLNKLNMGGGGDAK